MAARLQIRAISRDCGAALQRLSIPLPMRSADFERLYDEHAAALLGFLELRLGSRAVAEDIAADAFERVLMARRRFDPRRGSARGWLYSIAVNCARDHTRRQAAEARALEQVAVGESRTSSGVLPDLEERDLVMRALDQLSDDEREAIALRYGADLTLRDIATATRAKPATVEARVYRALAKLRELMDDLD